MPFKSWSLFLFVVNKATLHGTVAPRGPDDIRDDSSLG